MVAILVVLVITLLVRGTWSQETEEGRASLVEREEVSSLRMCRPVCREQEIFSETVRWRVGGWGRGGSEQSPHLTPVLQHPEQGEVAHSHPQVLLLPDQGHCRHGQADQGLLAPALLAHPQPGQLEPASAAPPLALHLPHLGHQSHPLALHGQPPGHPDLDDHEGEGGRPALPPPTHDQLQQGPQQRLNPAPPAPACTGHWSPSPSGPSGPCSLPTT